MYTYIYVLQERGLAKYMAKEMLEGRDRWNHKLSWITLMPNNWSEEEATHVYLFL
jgi:hypothetical protein